MASLNKQPLSEGIMGGTFDPIHLGHLLIARAALDELGLHQVIFLPDGDPPHKQPMATKSERLEMVRLACEGEPRFVVSDMELTREGRTYTVDTLMALKAKRPDADLCYLVGADTFLLFPSWRTADKVARLCRMAIVMRPGSSVEEVKAAQQAFMTDYGLKSTLLKAIGLPLSSSMVREAAASGAPFADMVPEKVADFIKQRGLYQPKEGILDA